MQPPPRPATTANRAPSSSQRPGSSMSVRPGSAMSSRGTPPLPVVVKKTRAPAKPRTDSSKPGPGRPRKKSPPETDPDSNTNDTTGAVPNVENSNQYSDVDSLTSGMKKIKISLLTKAQKEAKEEEKHRAKVEQSQATSSNMSHETRPTTADSETTYDQSAISTPMKSSSPGPATPQLFFPPNDPAPLEGPEQVSLPISSPITPTIEQFEAGDVSDHSPENSAGKFVPFQPHGPLPTTIAQQEPLRWLPPNTNTPAAIKKYDLPIFTSTSAIPFAPNPDVGNQNEPSNSYAKQDSSPSESTHLASSPWDIPAAP